MAFGGLPPLLPSITALLEHPKAVPIVIDHWGTFAARIFRGDESRRRRGRDVDSPRRRVATRIVCGDESRRRRGCDVWIFRGDGVAPGRDADVRRRRVAATRTIGRDRRALAGMLKKRGGSGATESKTGKKGWGLGLGGGSWKTRQFLVTPPAAGEGNLRLRYGARPASRGKIDTSGAARRRRSVGAAVEARARRSKQGVRGRPLGRTPRRRRRRRAGQAARRV